MLHTLTYTVPEDGLTIETILQDKWKLGKKLIHDLRMQKAVSDTSGELLQWKLPNKKGDVLVFTWEGESSNYLPSDQIPLYVAYEDEYLIIASKPRGVATHPNEVGQNHTFMNTVTHYLSSKEQAYGEHVHRIDEGTKGLVVVAKNPIVKGMLDRMLENKTIIRTYEAIVEGQVKNQHGTIRAAIGNDRHHPTRKRVSPSGQQAITHYEVVGRHPEYTKVHAILETGRTHQIRVHLAHLGHPIVGDDLYGAKKTATKTYELHAFKVQFMHPITGEMIIVEDKR
ncbi:RluA family pseudouridine synthase [Psychrobacillus soli]|uniref:Pseudouridine synthase n=1 Tax=Psychrobacillus soli TaxID=1543965 RepID=A0A544T0Q7_9BACI|nr:RluA family pseudouridine synthase [Psychrobacillus soli]TQR10970.1 RluA family pseudouridine synthase [Psychrobacillus soli]